jgi:hypothetical protein
MFSMREWATSAACWSFAAVGLGQDPPPSAPAVSFVNATEASGFVSAPGFGGHGIQIADVNGDGWLDVYVTNIFDETQDRPDLLFINQKQDPPRFTEEGRQRGVADDGFFMGLSEESHAAVFADLDADGDFDLFNAHTWNGHNRLYRNEGQGRFVDISEGAGLDVTDLGSRGVGAADFNGDGRLDIFVSGWQAKQPIIYWNQGGFLFERQRIKGVDNRPFANQGITIANFDGDGFPDLALTAFEYLQEDTVGPVALLRNDGERFIDVTDFAGIRYDRTIRDYRGSNGWSFADIDNDGDQDALIAGYHGAQLYGNNGKGRFQLLQRFEGLYYMGAFGDVDNDGDLDLYLSGDGGIYFNDRGHFSYRDGLIEGVGADARAAVFADVNNDGALDLVIASKLGPNTLLVNRTRQGSYVTVSLIGPSGEAGALGARATLYEAGHVGEEGFLRGFREVRGATGYCAQETPLAHFGVEPGKNYDLSVWFADGSTWVEKGLAPGRIQTIDARKR